MSSWELHFANIPVSASNTSNTVTRSTGVEGATNEIQKPFTNASTVPSNYSRNLRARHIRGGPASYRDSFLARESNVPTYIQWK